MTPLVRAIFAIVVLAGAMAAPAAAQAVRGDLRDADRDRLLPGARLYLLDEDGIAVDSTLTDGAGRYHLAAPVAGDYVVYFQIDGWASYGSEPLRLTAGSVADPGFRVPLIRIDAIRQMSDMVRADERLQSSLPEICGGALRQWEAGVLLGVVRERASGDPIAGARVAVATAGAGVARSTLSGEAGIYILCNVPLGPAVELMATAPDGTTETTDVEIRAGTISWYDLPLGPRR
jgi:hypothetical protein